jgi:hypothetical protein
MVVDRDASVRDLEMTVLSDCVTTVDPAMQAASPKTMTSIGWVIPAADFLPAVPAAATPGERS